MVSPPYFILKGFPRYKVKEEGRWIWKVPGDSGNPALTRFLSTFKDKFSGGVKVQYNRDGAIGEGTLKITNAVFIQVCICCNLGTQPGHCTWIGESQNSIQESISARVTDHEQNSLCF